MADLNLEQILANISDEATRNKVSELIDLVKPGTDGLVGLESSRLKIPTLKIVQPMSLTKADCPEGARVGQLYIPGINLGNSLEIIPVFAYNSRTMFVAGEQNGRIECSSVDSVNGSVHGKCSDCRHLPWRDDKKQLCMDNINVFALTADMSRFIRIIFAKTSESSGKFLLRQAARGRRVWDTKFTLATESKNSNGKSWLQFKVSVSAGAPSTEVHTAAAAFNKLVSDDYNQLKEWNANKLLAVEEPRSKEISVDSSDDTDNNFPF